MKKITITLAVAALAALGSATTAQAGPTCSDLGWKNHGEHVLTYVRGDGAAGGAPAHLSDRPDGPAPGASFCLDVRSPGLHF